MTETTTTRPYEIAYEALRAAGVEHAQLRDHYAQRTVEALATAGVLPAETCGDRWDEDTTCSLPPAHSGWHASSPWYDAERQEVHGGQTWTPTRTASGFRVCQ